LLLIVQDVAKSLSSDEKSKDEIKETPNNTETLPLKFKCGTVVKRFTKKVTKNTFVNKFNVIASKCFYTLASKYDISTKYLDLIDRDCLLLVELIRTLSIILGKKKKWYSFFKTGLYGIHLFFPSIIFLSY